MIKIKLRPPDYKDIPFMQEWMNDPDVMKGFRFDAKKASEEKALRRFVDNAMTDAEKNFVIANAETDEYLGTVSLKNINHKTRSAENAAIVRKKYQRQGIAAEAFRRLFAWGFENLDLESIYSYVLTDNAASCRMLEKVGMEHIPEKDQEIVIDGTTRKRYFYIISVN